MQVRRKFHLLEELIKVRDLKKLGGTFGEKFFMLPYDLLSLKKYYNKVNEYVNNT
jgi:hypothetical protein